jgi:MFS family permease
VEQAAGAHQAAAAAKAAAPQGEAGKRDSLWRHRDFMPLWGGQTVSEMGSSVTQPAFPLTAVVLLKASTFEVGLLTSAATTAFALIALSAGAIVDRHTKRGIMLACDAARVLIIGSVPLAWALGVLTLWQLYVVALAAGVATVVACTGTSNLFSGMCTAIGIVFLIRVLHVRPAPRCGSASSAAGPPASGSTSPRPAKCATSRPVTARPSGQAGVPGLICLCR